ncbi:MAG: CaiB/BaiF CoA-transferase family protein [Desulfobacterales bacterium]|nr:CaiB/BaiF CoA-transferase family protein [Desulfobacterales bacterium]
MTNCGALNGITVIDLSRLLPGPYASMVLADHGARVINIEDPRYRAEGLMVTTISRNKEHVALDLKHPRGKCIFMELAAQADVVLEGFRPGVVNRLGVDYEALRAVKPDIIYCSLTGYGQTGPYRQRAGHDVNYLACSGILDLMGYKDQPPAIPGIQLADMVGGLNAAVGILLALLARDRTGEGQYIDVSLTDSMLAMMPVVLLIRQLLGQTPQRGDSMLAHRYACYNTYETSDGRYLAVGCVETRFWENLCRFLDTPDLAPLQYDESRREEVIGRLRRVFKTRTLAEWEAAIEGQDICCEAVRTFDEAARSPLFQTRDMLPASKGKADDPDHLHIGLPVKMSTTPGGIRTPPVAFGENTTAVLAELGCSDEEIDDLRHEGGI